MDSTGSFYEHDAADMRRFLPSSTPRQPHPCAQTRSQPQSSVSYNTHPYLEESVAGPDGFDYFLHQYPPPPTPVGPGAGATIGYHRPIRAMPPSSPIAAEDEAKGPFDAPYSPAHTLVGSPQMKDHHNTSPSYRFSDSKRFSSTGNIDGRVLTYGEARHHHNHSSSFDHSSSNADETGVQRHQQDAQPTMQAGNKKGMRFWLIMTTLMVVMFLSAIDLTIISTALPTIIEELPRSSISGTWVTSSFLLTVTAFQPLMGGLADVLGRRNSLLLSIFFFLGGSVICALAKDMLILVVGRGVQGVGGGGIQAIVEIIISDITTLRERGLYMGAMGLVFAISSLVAPILGGVFSKHDWRWIFWLNLPIGGFASILCVPFLKLRRPPMDLKAQFHRMDIFGNFVLFGSVVSILIAVTEGGIEHPWSSTRIYVPLVVGIIGLIAFFLIEFLPNPLAKDPILPLRLFVHPTAAISFFLTFLHGIVFYGAVYVMPIYFQSIKDASPLQSAFDILPSTSPAAPAAVVAGLIMAITGKYKIQMILWWMLMTVGFGLIYLFDIDTPKWEWVIFQLIAGIAIGAIFALTLPPIQACLPVSEIAHATATFAFSRSFGSVWGIAIATAIFTSKVSPKLAAIPGAKEVGLTGQTALGFATELKKLPPELQAAVKPAFASALRSSFLFFIPLCAVGVIACFFMKDVPLPDFNDSEHGIRNSMPPPARMPSLSRRRTGEKSQEKSSSATQQVGPSSSASTMSPPRPDGAEQQNDRRRSRPPLPKQFSHLERESDAPSHFLSSDSMSHLMHQDHQQPTSTTLASPTPQQTGQFTPRIHMTLDGESGDGGLERMGSHLNTSSDWFAIGSDLGSRDATLTGRGGIDQARH